MLLHRQWGSQSGSGRNEKLKHIDIRYHFIREQVKKGNIRVFKINTKDNPAAVVSRNG